MAATSLSDKDLQELKEQAEAQQRRRAPPLAGKDPKRRKTAGGEEEDDDPEGTVARFSYAAADAIAAGSTCLMASCGFNRWAVSLFACQNMLANLTVASCCVYNVSPGAAASSSRHFKQVPMQTTGDAAAPETQLAAYYVYAVVCRQRSAAKELLSIVTPLLPGVQ